MGRPRADDPVYRGKRTEFFRLRGEGKSLRDCASAVGIALSVAQTWERSRSEECAPIGAETRLRDMLLQLITEGDADEAGLAAQLYWRVRLASPPSGAKGWRIEDIAAYYEERAPDGSTLESKVAPLGAEGHALRLQYFAAAARRAGLQQREDGVWIADPEREPHSPR